MNIRNVTVDDYSKIIVILDNWWGGRKMTDMLPRLFFVHFSNTSFIAEIDRQIVGFLVGFRSPTYLNQGYIHFAGVAPNFRQQGIARKLYDTFFIKIKTLGCQQVQCVTSVMNQQSIQYHLKMGFIPQKSDTWQDNIPYQCDYDGIGEDRVLLIKNL